MSQNYPPNQSSPHGPTRLLSYIQIHLTALEHFRAVNDFVGEDTLNFEDEIDGQHLTGEISCLGNIVIEVNKFLEYQDEDPTNPLVQTDWYSYNVLVRGIGNIFRYDNQDVDFSFRPGHRDRHHKHIFDWESAVSLPGSAVIELSGSPIWIGEARWPKLNEVIQEAYEWYWDHYQLLPHPHAYALIGVRSGSQQLRT